MIMFEPSPTQSLWFPRITTCRFETIHDFGSFLQKLFDLRYPALAVEVAELVQVVGLPVFADSERGWTTVRGCR